MATKDPSQLPVNIREATHDDLPKITALEYLVARETWPDAAQDIEEENAAANGADGRVTHYQTAFIEPPHAKLWVAVDKEVLAGFVGAHKEQSGVHWVDMHYILPPYQRHHVGSQLLRAACDWLSDAAEIRLSIPRYAAAAKAFYERHGFLELAETPAQDTLLPSGRVLPVVIMRKIA